MLNVINRVEECIYFIWKDSGSYQPRDKCMIDVCKVKRLIVIGQTMQIDLLMFFFWMNVFPSQDEKRIKLAIRTVTQSHKKYLYCLD